MKSFIALGISLLGLTTAPVLGEEFTLWGESGGQMEKRIVPNMSPNPALAPRQACVHGPTTRNCWLPGFDVTTSRFAATPNTGVTRTVSSLVGECLPFSN